MEQSLKICCSPETYKAVKNDEKYRMQVTQQALVEQESSFSQIIFVESESQESLAVAKEKHGEEIYEEPVFKSNIEANDGKPERTTKLQNWHDAPTKLMLTAMENLRPKLGKSIHLKTKGKMYKVISEKMAAEGYAFTPLQIENKFRGLERTFKKTVLNNRQTGRSRQSCAYESELSQILKEKKGIHPEFLLDNADVQEENNEENRTDTNTSFKDDEPSSSNRCKTKSKFGIRKQVLAKMEEIAEEKKDFHAKVLKLLNKKDERAQKREEISKRKLALLEKLVNEKNII